MKYHDKMHYEKELELFCMCIRINISIVLHKTIYEINSTLLLRTHFKPPFFFPFSFIYTGTMNNKTVVPELAMKLICICSPQAGCCYKITKFNQKQYNTYNTYNISHHTPLNKKSSQWSHIWFSLSNTLSVVLKILNVYFYNVYFKCVVITNTIECL